ncbi:hypothetical protein TNCV_2995151 [Trichonephila clavipes]|nr:hypothetical protein TNCV_2995151 [Trichonephila clavipes]
MRVGSKVSSSGICTDSGTGGSEFCSGGSGIYIGGSGACGSGICIDSGTCSSEICIGSGIGIGSGTCGSGICIGTGICIGSGTDCSGICLGLGTGGSAIGNSGHLDTSLTTGVTRTLDLLLEKGRDFSFQGHF